MFRSAYPGVPVNPNTHLYLAIDQGGHASRASLFTADGELHGGASVAIHARQPAAERVELDPEELVASVQAAVNESLRHAGSAPIVAAGLATQRSSVVCWDTDSGAALSPVLSWQDRRTADWLQQLAMHAAEIRQRTGLPLSPHYGASKLRWCWDHIPAVQNACKEGRLAWGPLASFLIYRLTEERTLAADPANASRTLLWNLDNGDWDPRLAQLFGIPIHTLPPCVATRYAWGHINAGQRRIPLTLVTGDQSAALFAAGEPAGGTAMINLGTGAFLQRGLTQRPPPSPLLSSLAYQDQARRIYALEGTVNGAGSAITWLASQLERDEAEIIRQLPKWLKQHSQPPLFLNGIAGLGTPYLRPLFASHFSAEATAAEKSVALCESIVFLLQINLEEMARSIGPVRSIIISGGLSKLDGICQRLANLSGKPLHRPQDHEATVQGLLVLLKGACGAAAQQRLETTFLPQTDPILEGRFQAWRKALEAALLR
jgi:glycerol kinase